MRNRNPEKERLYKKRWYEKNKQVYLDRNKAKRARSIEFLNSLKDVPCVDCGNRFPAECMDFDHISNDKSFNLANKKHLSIESLTKEADKCEVVCSNCHRIRTKVRFLGPQQIGK